MLIVIEKQTTLQLDSLVTDANGYSQSPTYLDGTLLHIAFGYQGGANQVGDSLKAYKFNWTITGNTLNTLATSDTTDHIKANLIPDELWQVNSSNFLSLNQVNGQWLMSW